MIEDEESSLYNYFFSSFHDKKQMLKEELYDVPYRTICYAKVVVEAQLKMLSLEILKVPSMHFKKITKN